jgi:hypothetical protein
VLRASPISSLTLLPFGEGYNYETPELCSELKLCSHFSCNVALRQREIFLHVDAKWWHIVPWHVVFVVKCGMPSTTSFVCYSHFVLVFFQVARKESFASQMLRNFVE